MIFNNIIIPLAALKMQAEIANLCILIMIAFYGKGNIGFKNTQRHLGAALGTPKFQTTHYMFIHTTLGRHNKIRCQKFCMLTSEEATQES